VRQLRITLLAGVFSGTIIAATAQPPAASADHVPEASIEAGKVEARQAQTFRGWGMSLAWEANDLYGGGRQPA